MERAQDVLMHKRLLQMACDPATRPAVEVRPVQVIHETPSKILIQDNAIIEACLLALYIFPLWSVDTLFNQL